MQDSKSMNSESAAQCLVDLRKQKPLVHNITNYVVMNFSANVLLSIGASPIMAHAPEEMEEMATICSALVLNIGTLSTPWIDSMILAGKTASKLGKPIILDPVGAGASKLRTESAWRIIKEVGVSAIRGNASEIMALHNADSKTKGVDATHEVHEAADIAVSLAKDLDIVVAATGVQDLITDGATTRVVSNGHSMLSQVTGTGCSATAVMGAFMAVQDDSLMACTSALAYFGYAGELAYEKAQAPGSFCTAFIDSLYEMTPEQFQAGAAISSGV